MIKIIEQVEAAGGILTLSGRKIQYRIPKKAAALVTVLHILAARLPLITETVQ